MSCESNSSSSTSVCLSTNCSNTSSSCPSHPNFTPANTAYISTSECSSSSSSECSSSSSSECSSSSSSECSSSSSSECSSSSSSECSSSSSSECSSSSSSSSECSFVSSTEGSAYSSEDIVLGKKKYNVTFGKKCGHVMADQIEGKVIYINEHQAPILKLIRGYTYYFNVKQKECDGKYENTFVLTQNPVGKYGCVAPVPLCGSFDPVSHGCVKFHVSECTPKYFYYQMANASFAGGLVVVSEPEPV